MTVQLSCCSKGGVLGTCDPLDTPKGLTHSHQEPPLLFSSPTRTHLHSLVVTSAESWFAASHSQASACAASPPICSLMHLQDKSQVPSEPSQALSPYPATAPGTNSSPRSTAPEWQL